MVGLEGMANRANSYYQSPISMNKKHKKSGSMSNINDFNKVNIKLIDY